MAGKEEDGTDQLFASEPMTLDPSTFELLAQVPDDEDAAAVVDLPSSLQEAVAGNNETSVGHNPDDDGTSSSAGDVPVDLEDEAPQSPQATALSPDLKLGGNVADVSGLMARAERFASSNRPFPCHVCGKRFTQKAHLIIHKRTHTGEKPYACHICHKRFAQSSHLTVHKRVHTGEKPFFCNFCGMGFCRRPRLEAHVLQHILREGRQMPANMRGDMLASLPMAGLNGAMSGRGASSGRRGGRGRGRGRGRGWGRGWASGRGRARSSMEESSSTSPSYSRGGDGMIPNVKSEPMEDSDDNDNQIEINDDSAELVESVIEQMNGDGGLASRRLSGPVTRHLSARRTPPSSSSSHNNTNGQHISYDELDNFIGSTSQSNGGIGAQTSNHHLRGGGGGGGGGDGLTMTGLVRTNSRVSLVDFTAPDIMQHLMSRDDVKSCDYCCIVFNDPAMYYLHRCMHDKMDVRRCNMCGRMAADKYDFMAHFLSQHK